jgi:hypothetical protein
MVNEINDLSCNPAPNVAFQVLSNREICNPRIISLLLIRGEIFYIPGTDETFALCRRSLDRSAICERMQFQTGASFLFVVGARHRQRGELDSCFCFWGHRDSKNNPACERHHTCGARELASSGCQTLDLRSQIECMTEASLARTKPSAHLGI